MRTRLGILTLALAVGCSEQVGDPAAAELTARIGAECASPHGSVAVTVSRSVTTSPIYPEDRLEVCLTGLPPDVDFTYGYPWRGTPTLYETVITGSMRASSTGTACFMAPPDGEIAVSGGGIDEHRIDLADGDYYVWTNWNAGGTREWACGDLTIGVPSSPTPPDGDPSGLAVDAVTDTGARAQWTDNSSNETDFTIERWDTPSTSWVEIAAPGANSTSWTLSGLDPDTRYGIRVRARNSLGLTTPSNEVWFRTEAAPVTVPTTAPDGVPGAFRISGVTATEAIATWTDNSSNEEDFVIERWDSPSTSWVELAAPAANLTTWTLTGLDPDTRYGLRVRARNRIGRSGVSNEQWFSTDASGAPGGGGVPGGGGSFEPYFADGFESYSAGASLNGGSPFGSAGRTTASRERAARGLQSARMAIEPGDNGGFGRWGGIVPIRPRLRAGEEVWVRFDVYWPSSFQFSASPWMKFIRLHSRTSSGGNGGYNDLYIDQADSSSSVLRTIKEGHHVWEVYDGAPIPRGRWERYEMYLSIDDVPASRGGGGRMRIWRDGELIFDRADVPTIPDSGGDIDALYLFTYWNNESPPANHCFVDDLIIATSASPPPNFDAAGHRFIGGWTGP
ncbi:MAG: fibronectin type III domain-containing protein [Myxococcota bacterium]|nr:fibronectin type III domain-containing protein [Myxococcota bacterium]